MHLFKLDAMKEGWFIGDFEPSVMQTKDFAVGWKTFEKGQNVEPYFHVLAPEANVIVRGRLLANDEELTVGDIFLVHPKEVCKLEFLEDTDLVVVKWPSVPGDEYPENVRDCGRVVV